MNGLERFVADILGRQIYSALSRARLGTATDDLDIRVVISEAIDIALGMLEQEDRLPCSLFGIDIPQSNSRLPPN